MEKKLTQVSIPLTKGFKVVNLSNCAVLDKNFNLKNLLKDLSMEEMIYEIPQDYSLKILAKGNFLDYDFYVISYGTHPCCYVRIPVGHKYYDKPYGKIPFHCHGCLNYGRKDFFDIGDQDYFIGWDYARLQDFTYGSSFIKGHKWTTEELVLECLESIREFVINQKEKK